MQLTPEILVSKGFKYIPFGIGGCDQWHGIAFWENKEKDLHLRGNISTAKGGYLQMQGQGIIIDSVEDLDKLLSLCK